MGSGSFPVEPAISVGRILSSGVVASLPMFKWLERRRQGERRGDVESSADLLGIKSFVTPSTTEIAHFYN